MARSGLSGPQEHHEKLGGELHRDTRRWNVRWREKLREGTTCAGVLAAGAAAVALVPGTVEFVVPPALLYAGAVFCGRVRLPMRTPMKARLRDPNDLDERNKPRMGQGADYLGHQLGTKYQCWNGLEDIPQHVAVPGTTGSGKTEALKSLALVNALAQGSGVLYVDGKGQTKLYAEFMALCRKYGREDDVFILNFLTANGSDSFTLAPFSKARANMIREILVGQLNEPGGDGNSAMFHGRVVAFLGIIAPILEWLRTERGVPTTLERVRDLTELANVVRIAQTRHVKFTDSKTGAVQTLDLHDLPNEYVQGLRDYLGQTGGFDLDVSIKDQKSTQPAEQHSFVAMQLTEVFSQWLMTLGHIFRTESGDIDMRDVVLNRRVLVVILPVLEGSEKTTAALGKIIVAMLKSVMALSLGGRVEGEYDDIIANQPADALASFRVVFDELVYYATPGMDAMLAMARGLRIQFLLGFQEAAGLKARIGERLFSLLGNANLQVIMRLQEGGETRTYVEKTAGTMQVTQSTSFRNTSEYTNDSVVSDNSEVREVNRVSWADVRKLKPGEAILVFGSRLVHARIPYTKLDMAGAVRRNRPCVLPPPHLPDLHKDGAAVAMARKALLSSAGTSDAGHAGMSEELRLLLASYGRELAAGVPAVEASRCAAVSLPDDLPVSALPLAAEDAEVVDALPHAFSGMLRAAEIDALEDASPPSVVLPIAVDSDVLKQLVLVERAGGLTVPEAKIAARAALSLYATGLRAPQPTHLPAVPHEKLVELIDGLTAAIEPRPAREVLAPWDAAVA